MSIVITGASGNLGRRVAELVLEKAAPSDLVLVTRSPEALADLAERGVDVRAGDFDDPESLQAAFAGGEKLLLISTDVLGDRVAQHGRAVSAAAAAGVRSVVYTSALNPSDSNPAAVAAEHRGTEEAIRAAGVAWTFLRMGIYAETLAPAAAGALATGTLLSNEGDGRTSYLTRDDCAAAAAAVLTSGGHDGKTYDITGAEALGARELAALYSELGGKPVEPVFVDDAAWIDAMVEHAGMPRDLATTYATFGKAARQGYNGVVSETFEQLTGRQPKPVREVLAGLLA